MLPDGMARRHSSEVKSLRGRSTEASTQDFWPFILGVGREQEGRPFKVGRIQLLQVSGI
jgi:hypothetical protein